ncbi:MAG TPA: PQQ-binding-like beta-propeller repeat protein [Polyangia bacterium]|nr:PQQ-binding-like beta-propeller repeat protein [Polyangia bacterium]
MKGAGLRLPATMGLALTVLAAAGCATENYDRAGNAGDVALALAKARPAAPGPVNRTTHALAFVALGGVGGARLAAFDLQQKNLLWTQPAELSGRVEVGSDVIVHARRGGGVVGRDLSTGAVLWEHPVPPAERLLGYAVDESLVVLVLQSGGETLHGGKATVVALDARSGGQRWQRELRTGNVGAPAARGGLVAVLVQSQYVTILDGRDGSDLAQVLSNEEAATFVRALPEGFAYGSKGAFLLEPATAAGSRRSPGYVQAKLPRFVRPFYHYDMYRPEQSDYSAIDRNRILWRLSAEGDKARFRGGLVAVHNYRFFFGLDAESGQLRWAYNQPSVDAVSSDHTGGAIVFVTAEGEFGALDAVTGQKVYSARLPGSSSVRGATFDAEGFSPGAGSGAAPALATVLSSIVWDPDKRFSDVKVFAIEQMARLPGSAVTADLLKVGEADGLPPGAYQKAADALVERHDESAIEQYVAALKVHTDYVDDRKAQMVGTLARAAAVMKARPLAAPLIEHLRLPDTDPLTAAEIARALAAMGATEALPALRSFLSLYRADPSYEGDPAALLTVSEAILTLGSTGERPFLTTVAEERLTVDPLRLYLRRALAETAPPEKEQSQDVAKDAPKDTKKVPEQPADTGKPEAPAKPAKE